MFARVTEVISVLSMYNLHYRAHDQILILFDSHSLVSVLCLL
jgi:hypothetical protein